MCMCARARAKNKKKLGVGHISVEGVCLFWPAMKCQNKKKNQISKADGYYFLKVFLLLVEFEQDNV